MSDELRDFEKFMKQREQVATAYTSGDAEPLGKIVTNESPATFFGPQGGYKKGAETVWSQYESDSGAFEPGSTGEFEILHMAASDGLAYWVGYQRATAHMRGMDKPMEFNLRVTELFRREGDEWKLIHRHADPLAEKQDPLKK